MDDKTFEAEISAEGTLIVVDEEIALSDAPEAVRKTITDKTAGGSIRKIEKATKGQEVYYEAEFAGNGKKGEVKVDPKGKVIEIE